MQAPQAQVAQPKPGVRYTFGRPLSLPAFDFVMDCSSHGTFEDLGERVFVEGSYLATNNDGSRVFQGTPCGGVHMLYFVVSADTEILIPANRP